MSADFPQFGNPDYSGFTTDEEIARRYIATSARGSPTIGARMYMPTASMPPPMVHPVCGVPIEDVRDEMSGAAADKKGGAGAAESAGPKPVSEAIMDVFRSRPVSAFDWIIIFILIIAAICFFEYANVLLGNLFQTHSRHGGRVGGDPFCATCGSSI